MANSPQLRPQTMLVGATGLLGRPIARRLVQEGVPVRVLARDPDRARTVLPDACEIVSGDVSDDASLRAACDGMEAVYINLSAPRRPKVPDTELQGTRRIVAAARACGVRHVLKISAQGVPAASASWWQIRHKAESEQCIAASGLDYTIFQPTWFLESLLLFRAGPWLVPPRLPDDPIWWIAGDDYARQVAAALTRPAARNRTYVIQGPEPMSFATACRRLAAAWRPRPLRTARFPMALVRAMAPLVPDARYLLDLLRITFETNTTFEAQQAWDDLGRPAMTPEDFARYVESSGDVPRK